MEKPIDFQSMIMNLQHFWAGHGCLIWQPYYQQVGAGTMNPATFLRVLGPEPWKVAYVEPSVRPDDGRYGENPYRFQQHYQFQVILKPDPGNPQELYLQSLQAIGIDARRHDIRFVEDNWESPALGAWGLGWEVWLDGQEITQFTYFQQAGGFTLDPVSVEITYGLERIAMPLQGHYHFRDLKWNQAYTLGEVNYQGENEHSRYYFETADVGRLRQMYDLFEKEANLALEKGLVLPAHDYVLKCSHTFNILDTRGAIGVTERQALFKRMRELSHRSAEAYLKQRQELEFPWMEKKSGLQTEIMEKTTARAHVKASQSANPQTLLIEIGTEELPVGDLKAALEQLNLQVPSMLEELHLNHGMVKIAGTPRRLVILVKDLAARQEDIVQIIKGPPVERGIDAEGNYTQAAEGFARRHGIPVKSLKVDKVEGGNYLVAKLQVKGKTVGEILATALPNLIGSLHFDKSMRWNKSNVAFSRPIRWLLALFGDQLIDFDYAGLSSSNITRGLRFLEPNFKIVNDVDDYQAYLTSQGIELDVQDRKKSIGQQVTRLLKEEGATLEVDADLLDEVTNLVETPTAVIGSFDPSHLEIPFEVLISVMKKNQRYFPITKPDGKLLPNFIYVRNGDDKHLDSVTLGNEQVIQARFADARFFIQQDTQNKIDEFLPRLKTLIFHLKLGSMLEKSTRISMIVEQLAEILKLNVEERKVAMRAAELCKADLVSHMVVEMTSLQGVMGRYYALQSGESQEVGQAIEEHYYPRFSGDVNPKSKIGLVVGLADRLDSLAGLFAAGMAPSGTKDPFGLRRTALGMVQNLIHWNLFFNLSQGLDLAGNALKSTIVLSKEQKEDCLSFIIGRLENYLLEQGFRYDVIKSVLAEQGENPARAFMTIKQLEEWVKRKDWSTILPAYARCVRITRGLKTIYPVNSSLFTEEVEKKLANYVQKIQSTLPADYGIDDFLRAFQPVIPVIDQFFEEVLVMAEEQDVRENRLGLLQQISAMTNGNADFSKLEGF